MSAPERIYIAEEPARVFFDMASPGKQEYIRADIHEAEIEALRAENERLKSYGKNERHPDDMAVDTFAKAMKAKMKASREKGRHGWEYGNIRYLAAQLIYHVKKGDPVDVANFCMMLHNRGQSEVLSRAWVAEVDGKAPPKVLSAEEVTEPGFYWSSCGAKSNHWVPVWVLRDRPNSLYYAFPGSAADYSLKGLKFIGPIQTPEV